MPQINPASERIKYKRSRNARLEATILELARNPRVAHQALFKQSHTLPTPSFHWEMIDLWHSDHPRVVIQAFRGAGKTSIAEEALIIDALFERYKNGVLLGETEPRALERLHAIKHQFETNEYIEELFGPQKGPIWQERKIILRNGVIIHAVGQGQSLRGTKHQHYRPDRVFIDDIENKDTVLNLEAIEKVKDWLFATVLPALDEKGLVRMNGTPLHEEAVICKLAQDPDWISKVYPARSIDENGERYALWPEKRSIEDLDKMEQQFTRMGLTDKFNQEMLCKATSPASKPFTAAMIKVEPRIRTWEATYAMFDPARTSRTTSAMTGVAIWSWIGNRLIVWDAFGGFWPPDEILSRIFDVDREYKPVAIGIEKDGLEQFILQPLRQEQVKRGTAVPVRPMSAPRTGPDSQTNFISSLQPFFKSGEVTFVKDCADARAQFLNFSPNAASRRDIPNALAYALILRPGQPIYDNFGPLNVEAEIPQAEYAPTYLAVNSDGSCTAGALLQLVDGSLRVLADWVREGDPGTNLDRILREARLVGGSNAALYAPREHFTPGGALIGLRQAARHVPCDIFQGGDVGSGREEIRNLLSRTVRSRPALLVASRARWTLNALAGGFAREVTKDGRIMATPSPGAYRVLMEGIEGFAALMGSSVLGNEDERHYEYTTDGRKFLSSKAQ